MIIDPFDYAKRIGPMYGMQDFSIFLYALVRMHQPKLVFELGSGSGTCALLCATAMKENGFGKFVSFDNGSQWESIREDKRISYLGLEQVDTYSGFLQSLGAQSGLTAHLEFVDQTVPPFPEPSQPIDLLLADYSSSQHDVSDLLKFFIPRMADSASIFIDGASSSYRTFLFLEDTIAKLNRGKIPGFIAGEVDDQDLIGWIRLLHIRAFKLLHLTRPLPVQNSTAWIRVEPVDHFPYPPVTMR
ncbi:class I SAM-dependent methyltransferase [Bradyrhizobium diazoefficiens]|uniref:class I SAM-dependent methyltransferase n=1 Tax=Bradyrhizobium diazoefficiens TaxID=1355477 RepID=UPI0034814EAB